MKQLFRVRSLEHVLEAKSEREAMRLERGLSLSR
jgi:hypothetical protein